MKGQYEFNVELKNSGDVKFALERFEKLWNDSDAIDVNKYVEEILLKETWINEDITPYELYLKVLYEHFKDEINQDKKSNVTLFKELEALYQKYKIPRLKDFGYTEEDIKYLSNNVSSSLKGAFSGNPINFDINSTKDILKKQII